VDREGKPAPRRSRERRVVHVRSEAVTDEARFRRRREPVPVPTDASHRARERTPAQRNGQPFGAEARALGAERARRSSDAVQASVAVPAA